MNKYFIKKVIFLILISISNYSISVDLFEKIKDKFEKSITNKNNDSKNTSDNLSRTKDKENLDASSKENKILNISEILEGQWGTIETCGFKKLSGTSLNNFSVHLEGKEIEIKFDRFLMGAACNIETGWGCKIAKSKIGKAHSYKNLGKIISVKSLSDSTNFVVEYPINQFDDKYFKNWISTKTEYEYSKNTLRVKNNHTYYQQMDAYDRNKKLSDNADIHVENFKYSPQQKEYFGSDEAIKYIKCEDEIHKEVINQWIDENKQLAISGEENTKKCSDALAFLDKATTRNEKKAIEMIIGDLSAKTDRTWQFDLKKEYCGIGKREEVCASNDICRKWIMSNYDEVKKSWRTETAEDLFFKYKNYMFLSDCNEIRKDYLKKYVDPSVFQRIKNKMKKIESDALKTDPSINKVKLWDDAAVEYKLTLGILTGANKSNPQNFDREVAAQCQIRITQMDGMIIPSKEEDYKIKKDF